MRYFFTLLAALATQMAYAQCCPYLSPVRVLPANPTSADQIRLVFQATTGGRGGKIGGTFSRAGNNLTFTGCYHDGMAAQPLSYTDTVRVGQLPAGSYTITFVGVMSLSTQECQEYQRNTSYTALQVSSALATRPAGESWAVYPTPATGGAISLLIPSDKQVNSITLLDAVGRPCYAGPGSALRPEGGGHWRLPLPALPTGAYTLRLDVAGAAAVAQRVLLE